MQLGQYGIPRDIRSCILNGRDIGDVIPALREVSLCSLCINILLLLLSGFLSSLNLLESGVQLLLFMYQFEQSYFVF